MTEPDARLAQSLERHDALLGVLARRRARGTFAPIALSLMAIAVAVGGVAWKTAFFSAETTAQVARASLTLFYCSVPVAVILTLRTARRARQAGIDRLREGGGAADFASMIAAARRGELAGAAWVRLGFAAFFVWLHLCLVAWLRPDAATLAGATVVAAATILVGTLGAAFVTLTLRRKKPLAPLATTAVWGGAVILIGLILAIWRTPAPEGHLGGLLVWLGLMRQTRGVLFRTLIEERQVLSDWSPGR